MNIRAVYNHPPIGHLDWTDAACTPDPRWTTTYKPALPAFIELAAICHTCPIIAQCAQYALDEHPHGGVYAGVWLPARHSLACHNARDELAAKTRPMRSA